LVGADQGDFLGLGFGTSSFGASTIDFAACFGASFFTSEAAFFRIAGTASACLTSPMTLKFGWNHCSEVPLYTKELKRESLCQDACKTMVEVACPDDISQTDRMPNKECV
jgi:hypothetical protein